MTNRVNHLGYFNQKQLEELLVRTYPHYGIFHAQYERLFAVFGDKALYTVEVVDNTELGIYAYRSSNLNKPIIGFGLCLEECLNFNRVLCYLENSESEVIYYEDFGLFYESFEKLLNLTCMEMMVAEPGLQLLTILNEPLEIFKAQTDGALEIELVRFYDYEEKGSQHYFAKYNVKRLHEVVVSLAAEYCPNKGMEYLVRDGAQKEIEHLTFNEFRGISAVYKVAKVILDTYNDRNNP